MGLPRIVGITGYARHGKDTVAEVLVRELGYTRVALADRMKELMLTLNPIVKQYTFPRHPDTLQGLVGFLGWDEAKKEPEVRRLLQVFGTEVGRQGLGEDVWIEALAKSTKGFYGNERKIVIPDIRFINEAQFIHRMHGEVWRVTRVGPDENTPFDNGIGLGHESERQVGAIQVDDTLINGGTKAQFQDRVLRYLRNRLAMVTSFRSAEVPPEGLVEEAIQEAREQYRGALDELADR